MRLLVLGGDGMLGHKMLQTLEGHGDEVCCTLEGSWDDPAHGPIDLFREDNTLCHVDLMNYLAFEPRLRELRPDVVVNCVGIIKQRPDAKSPLPSIELNALLPHRLAETCREWSGRVVHFSTDCVFSGREGGYTEESPSDAEDLYGKTKYLGEVQGENALTLRTSIIGRELSHFGSLLEWFLSQEGRSVHGYTGAIYSGVTTNHLADLVGDLLRDHPGLSGLYHVVSEPITKHDLLRLIGEAYGLHIEIVPDGEVRCDRSMKGDRLRQAIGYVCPAWPDLVAQLAADPTPYDRWR
jgi:dTDP-4-dehydrorhamnose reductase